jgi:hypothetical protein
VSTAGQIIPVHRYVEGTARGLHTGDVLDHSAQSSGKHRAPGRNTEQNKIRNFRRGLDNFMGNATKSPIDV